MRHATALLYQVCAVASRNIRFASCGTSGKLTLWTRYVCYVEENSPLLWSSGQSPWQQNGGVLFPMRYELNLYIFF
jgi:hypothetical protein